MRIEVGMNQTADQLYDWKWLGWFRRDDATIILHKLVKRRRLRFWVQTKRAQLPLVSWLGACTKSRLSLDDLRNLRIQRTTTQLGLPPFHLPTKPFTLLAAGCYCPFDRNSSCSTTVPDVAHDASGLWSWTRSSAAASILLLCCIDSQRTNNISSWLCFFFLFFTPGEIDNLLILFLTA